MVKKSMIILSVLIAMIVVISAVFILSSQKPVEDEVDYYVEGYKLIDPTLENLTVYTKKPEIVDGILYVDSGVKGENVKILLSSLAIQNIGPAFGWTTLLYENVFLPKFITTKVVDSGTYDRIYMYVSKVVVEVDGVEHDAILPNNRFLVEGDFVKIDGNEMVYLKLNFISDNETLFKTVDNEYVYSPKIQILTYRNATVNDSVIEEGVLWTNVTVGMDINGEVMAGNKINSEKDIKYENGKLSYV